MTDETAYSLRKWASEMRMGFSLSSEQAPLLKEAADQIDRLRASLNRIIEERLEFAKDTARQALTHEQSGESK